MSLNANAELTLWNNYVDLQADVKPYLQIPSNNTGSDVMLQLVTDFVCQYSQKLIGQPMIATAFDRRFDGWSGWNGAYLMLQYYPVLEITSVIEYWGVSGPHILTEQTPTNQVDGFQCEYLTGRLTRVFPGLVQKPWFPGSRNIEVQWVAGRNPVPADIKLAALELIAYWWRNTQQASRTATAAAGSEYDPAVATGLWAGLPHRIEAIFSSYMQVGIG
jgi:hypothetical protein